MKNNSEIHVWKNKGSLEFTILALILIISLLLRLAYLFEIQKDPHFSNPVSDASFNDYWAWGVAAGDWSLPGSTNDPLINTTPYQRFPGYPWFLSVIYSLFGHNYFAVRVVQMLLGLGNALLLFFLARKWFGSAVGLLSACFMSFYWIFIYFEGELYAPVLSVFFVLLLILLLSRWVEKTSFLQCAVTGIILGMFALVRANILLFIPVAALWFLWISNRRKNLRSFLPAMFGFSFGIMLVVAPVTIRNYVVAKEMVLINSYGGLQLSIGNSEISDGIKATIPNLKEIAGLYSWTPYDYPQIVRGLERKLGRSLTYSEAANYWINEALDYIREHPWKSLKLTLRKAALFWGPKEISNPTEIYYVRLQSPILRNIPGNFPAVLSLSILGIILLFYNFRLQSKSLPFCKTQNEIVVLILIFIATYFASFLPFLVSARFRVPIIPFLLLFGSYGLYHMFLLLQSRNLQKALYFLFVFILVYFAVSRNFLHYKPNQAKWFLDSGSAYFRKGQTERAMKNYREALRIKPDYSIVHNSMGLALTQMGKLDDAIGHYNKALRIQPDYTAAHNNMGIVMAKKGLDNEAITHFLETLRIKPDYASAYYNLANALTRQGKLDDAIKHYTTALQIRQGDSRIHNNLGAALVKQGKITEAVFHYSEALRIKPDYAQAHYNYGVALAKGKRFNEAIRHYHEALKIKPDDIKVHSNLGIIMIKQGNLNGAITHFNEALRINPDSAYAHFNMGIVLERQGKAAKAIEHFKESLRIKPDFKPARKNLELALQKTGKLN